MSDTLLDKNKIWQQIDDEKENMLQLWQELVNVDCCLLYTSPSPRDA